MEGSDYHLMEIMVDLLWLQAGLTLRGPQTTGEVFTGKFRERHIRCS